MFKRIVSKLPYNPSLIAHLHDYDLKLKKELKTRLVALALLSIVILVQVIVLIHPPVNSTIYSPNDLIPVSNNSASSIYSDCTNNIGQYQNILAFYKIKCSELNGRAELLRLNMKKPELFSLNRLVYGEKNELRVTIDKQNLYIRHLSYGNSLSTASIKVFRLKINSANVYINAQTGNVISSKSFLINGQLPQICTENNPDQCLQYYIAARDITSGQTDVNKATVSSNDLVAYTLLVGNVSRYNLAHFKISVNVSNALAYSKLVDTYGGTISNGTISYALKQLAPNQTQTEEIITRIKSPIPTSSVDINDPSYFNQKMVVSFGNTLTISVPKSFNKFYEIDINNGLPASSYTVSFGILIIMSVILLYFSFRALLIREEIKIVKHNHANLTKEKK